MKNFIKYALLLSAIVLTVVSCQDDEDITPGSIIDTWRCEENHPVFGVQHYFVDIMQDPNDSTKVNIFNFLGLNSSMTDEFYASASVDGYTLTISTQVVETHTVSGEGTISGNYKTINLEYTDDDGSGVEYVTATYTRQ